MIGFNSVEVSEREVSKIEDCVIIGAGASGLSVAWKLNQLGITPLMIDAGWEKNLASTLGLRFPSTTGSKGLAKKTHFGDDSMYLYPKELINDYQKNDGLPISSYFGGLTTVWGSNIQVYDRDDLERWGFTANSIQKQYEWLLKKMPHIGADDNLSGRFPWPIKFDPSHPASSRMRTVLDSLKNRTPQFHFGFARNATNSPNTGCTMCGLCLEGCPQNVIFNAASHLLELHRNDQVRIRTGSVSRIEVDNEYLLIHCLPSGKNSTEIIKTRRAYLAAGSIATASILQRSNMIPKEILLDDTQVLYIPFLSTRRRKKSQEHYGLAQVFVAADLDSASKGHDFHISIYESDSSWQQRAEQFIGFLAKTVPKFLYRQLIGGIGFLPSEISGKIKITLTASGTSVNLLPPDASEIKSELKSIFKKLKGDLRASGLIPIVGLVQVPNVGSSYHVGVLRDLSHQPLVSKSGQVNQSIPIFVCDGASMLHLPTGPVTLTIMANAARIVEESYTA
jgi:hypothetical protein